MHMRIISSLMAPYKQSIAIQITPWPRKNTNHSKRKL